MATKALTVKVNAARANSKYQRASLITQQVLHAKPARPMIREFHCDGRVVHSERQCQEPHVVDLCLMHACFFSGHHPSPNMGNKGT
jgi:hypothetical protein